MAKFKNHGIGKLVAHKIWQMHPGKWEISVVPENKRAINFWEKCINSLNISFEKSIKIVDYDAHQPNRVIFLFDSYEKR